MRERLRFGWTEIGESLGLRQCICSQVHPAGGITWLCSRPFSLASQSKYGPVSSLDRLRMCGHCQEVKAQVETVYNLGADVGNLDAPEG